MKWQWEIGRKGGASDCELEEKWFTRSLYLVPPKEIALKSTVVVLLFALCVVALVTFQRSQAKQSYAEKLRTAPQSEKYEDFVIAEPPRFSFQTIEEEKRAYEIALKEFKESKIEILELEHNHMNCILMWEYYRSKREMENVLSRMTIEGVERMLSDAEDTSLVEQSR